MIEIIQEIRHKCGVPSRVPDEDLPDWLAFMIKAAEHKGRHVGHKRLSKKITDWVEGYLK